MKKANVSSLICDGKVSLPCGTFNAFDCNGQGMELRTPRGRRLMLTVVRAGVSGMPDAVGFVIHDHRRNIAEYALTADGRVLECV
jgi:hypothetical protein